MTKGIEQDEEDPKTPSSALFRNLVNASSDEVSPVIPRFTRHIVRGQTSSDDSRDSSRMDRALRIRQEMIGDPGPRMQQGFIHGDKTNSERGLVDASKFADTEDDDGGQCLSKISQATFSSHDENMSSDRSSPRYRSSLTKRSALIASLSEHMETAVENEPKVDRDTRNENTKDMLRRQISARFRTSSRPIIKVASAESSDDTGE